MVGFDRPLTKRIFLHRCSFETNRKDVSSRRLRYIRKKKKPTTYRSLVKRNLPVHIVLSKQTTKLFLLEIVHKATEIRVRKIRIRWREEKNNYRVRSIVYKTSLLIVGPVLSKQIIVPDREGSRAENLRYFFLPGQFSLKVMDSGTCSFSFSRSLAYPSFGLHSLSSFAFHISLRSLSLQRTKPIFPSVKRL